MVKFIIIRHGYSQFNKEHRYTGQADVPLDELGVWQAKRTAKYVLANYRIDSIYSSDLCRAIDTAKPVAEALDLPIHQEKELREIYFGRWQGRPAEEVRQDPEYQLWEAGGESDCGAWESKAALRERVKAVFAEIAEENEGKTVLIATHGGVVEAAMREWLNLPAAEKIAFPGNASVSVVTYDLQTHAAQVLLVGYREHLESNKM